MAATSWQLQLRLGSNPRRSRSLSSIRRNGNPKRRKPKPPWDSTVSDLSLYKASREEMLRRHELHLPKPDSERENITEIMLAKLEKENKPPRKTVYMEAVEKKKAMIREKFYNQEKELQQVLSQTDQTMAQVRDLFGDDPMKYTGHPHITAAPRVPSECDRSVIFLEPDIPSRLTALSESVMITPALNEISDNEEENGNSSEGESPKNDTDDEEGTMPYSEDREFQSRLDLNYYQKLLQEEEMRLTSGETKNDRNSDLLSQRLDGMTEVPRVSEQSIVTGSNWEHLGINGSTHIRTEFQDANPHRNDNVQQEAANVLKPITGQILNVDGSKNDCSVSQDSNQFSIGVQNTMQEHEQRRHKSSLTASRQGDQSKIKTAKKSDESLNKFEDMKTILDTLDNELTEYEKDTGREHFQKFKVSGTFSGYTASLLNAVFRVIHHLKESDIQMRAEMAIREQIMDEFEEQKALVDALTADLLHTQEQNRQLHDEFRKYKLRIDSQYDNLRNELCILLKSLEHRNDLNRNNVPPASTGHSLSTRGNANSINDQIRFRPVGDPLVSFQQGFHLSKPTSHPHIDLLRHSAEEQQPSSVEEVHYRSNLPLAAVASSQTQRLNPHYSNQMLPTQQQISPSISPISYLN